MRDKVGKTAQEDGEYITSLARGLSVLRSFSKERPEMTLSQVAAATSLSAATARRCRHTLVDLGYVAKRGRLFLLRPTVVAFASAYIESMNLARARPACLPAAGSPGGIPAPRAISCADRQDRDIEVGAAQHLRAHAAGPLCNRAGRARLWPRVGCGTDLQHVQ